MKVDILKKKLATDYGLTEMKPSSDTWASYDSVFEGQSKKNPDHRLMMLIDPLVVSICLITNNKRHSVNWKIENIKTIDSVLRAMTS